MSSSELISDVTVFVLAGNRPGQDPLRDATGASHKALVSIHGRPLLDYVLAALDANLDVAQIVVAAQDHELLRHNSMLVRWTNNSKISWIDSESSIAATLTTALKTPSYTRPLLITTADNALLQPETIAEFITKSTGADLAIGMVERSGFSEQFPENRRTWLKFADGQWSGANLFYIGSGDVSALLNIWKNVEQDRKKGWRLISAFGPLLLIRAILRLIGLKRAISQIGNRHNLSVRLVPLSNPEACIDVDKLDDLALAAKLIERRHSCEN